MRNPTQTLVSLVILSGLGLVGGFVFGGTRYTGTSGTRREVVPDSFVRGSDDLEDLGVATGDIPSNSPISFTLSGVSKSASVGVIPVDRLGKLNFNLERPFYAEFYEIHRQRRYNCTLILS